MVQLMNKRALVTGAAGFIGSHVAHHLLSSGMEVIATDDLSGGNIKNVPEGCKWIQGDLKNSNFVKSLWENYKYDYVFHLGAYAAEGLSHFIRCYNYETNLIASMNLINESVKNEVECFIFTSSIAVYGTGQIPMTENTIPTPEDPYGISKYAVELDLKAAHEMFGLNYIIFRPHNVYGEKQNIADKYRNVIGIFMNQLLQNKPMTIFGDGYQTRAFSYIDDVAPIIANSANVHNAINQTFNIGADLPYNLLTLAREVAISLDVPYNAIHLPARNEVVHAYCDHSKIKKIFNPKEPTNLKTGLKKMADWVKEQGPMNPIVFENIEIIKNLPPSWMK